MSKAFGQFITGKHASACHWRATGLEWRLKAEVNFFALIESDCRILVRDVFQPHLCRE